MQIEKIDTDFETNLENLQAYLANVCSVVRDSTPKDNERLWNRLLKESYGDKPSSVFSFIPCILDSIDLEFLNLNQLFGYSVGGYYFTNLRELLNAGISVDNAIKFVNFDGYKAFKCITPYFIYQQIRTHTQINFISHSNRYSESKHGYWKPDEVSWRQDVWDNRVHNEYSPSELEETMKETFGIKRREIFARGADMLRHRAFTIGGTFNNPNSLPHFFNERGKSLHTQKETRDFVNELSHHILGDREDDR